MVEEFEKLPTGMVVRNGRYKGIKLAEVRADLHNSIILQNNRDYRLAMDSLANHQFPTFGHKIEDPHRGIILHSGGELPAMRAAQSLAARQHTIQMQHQMRLDRMVQTAKLKAGDRTITDYSPSPAITSPSSTGPTAGGGSSQDYLGGHDYLVRKDGSIKTRKSTNHFDRFYKEVRSYHNGRQVVRNYELVAVHLLIDPDRNGNKSSYWAKPTDLNPYTTRRNLLGLSYPGGDNPQSFNGKDNFTYIPDDWAEYPAIAHDRRYDRLGVKGVDGLVNDPRAIGADWTFVVEELAISTMQGGIGSLNGIRSTGYALGLGGLALKKTIIQPSKPLGMSEIVFWYQYSNIGVSYQPERQSTP